MIDWLSADVSNLPLVTTHNLQCGQEMGEFRASHCSATQIGSPRYMETKTHFSQFVCSKSNKADPMLDWDELNGEQWLRDSTSKPKQSQTGTHSDTLPWYHHPPRMTPTVCCDWNNPGRECVCQKWLQAEVGASEGAAEQGELSGLNQPSERNERGHVYEEVIPRGNRADRIVSVSVWRGLWGLEGRGGGGGGARGLWEWMVLAVLFKTLSTNHVLMENKWTIWPVLQLNSPCLRQTEPVIIHLLKFGAASRHPEDWSCITHYLTSMWPDCTNSQALR